MILATVARLCVYLGITLVLGDVALLFLRPTGRPDEVILADRFSVRGWALLTFGLLLWILAQALAMELSPTVAALRMLVGETTWGRGWLILAISTAIGFGFGMWRSASLLIHFRESTRWIALCLALTTAVALGGLGHAAADDAWPTISRVIDALHVTSVGAWIGSLLIIFYYSSMNEHDVHVLEMWQVLSRLATVAAPLAVLSGTGATILRLQGATLAEVVRSDYGRLLALKIGLVLSTLIFGMLSRRRVVAGTVPDATLPRREMWFALAVFAATSVLTGTAPPGE